MNTITPGQLADELESGKWRKAKSQLARQGNRRCCLGVACEMIGTQWDSRPAEYWDFHEPMVPRDKGLMPFWTERYAPVIYRNEEELASLNDTSPGWAAVIAELRKLETQETE